MAAEPVPEPDLDTLAGKIDAVAYGVSLMHADVRAVRQAQDEQGQVLAVHGEMLAKHGDMLEEILRRLPPQP